MKLFRRKKRPKARRGNGAAKRRLRRGESGRRTPAPEPTRHPRFFIAVAIGVWVVCCIVVSFRRPAPPVHLAVGEIADRNIYSEVPFRYEDTLATERLRERAARDVPSMYRLSQPAVDASLQALDDLLDQVARRTEPGTENTESAEGGTDSAAAGAGEGRFSAFFESVDADTLEALAVVASGSDQRRLLKEAARDTLNAGIAEPEEIAGLTSSSHAAAGSVMLINHAGDVERRSEIAVEELEDVDSAARDLAADLAPRFSPGAEVLRPVLEELFVTVFRPTMVYSTSATEKARREAVASVRPVERFVDANEILLFREQVVTQEIIDKLETHQRELFTMQSAQRGILGLVQAPVVCLFLLIAAWYVLYVVRGSLMKDRGLVLMVGLIIVMQVVLTRLVTNLHYLNSGSSFYLFPLLPLAFGAMLLSPLAGLRVAIVSAVYTTGVAMLQIRSPEAFQLGVIGVIPSLLGAALMRRARRRNHFLGAGLAVFGSVLILELVFCMRGNIPPGAFGRVFLLLLGYSFVNALGIVVLLSILLPLFEFAFNATTDMTLVEMSDLNHPLLKRLQLEAPGSYHHSLQVATLAEQAAEAIGANPLLARVCAYFHDIGKLTYPEYFTENTQVGVDPHQDLQPRMSSLVILNHVKQGIELAKKSKLKRPLREAIAQHHGTTLVYFFYRKAKDQENEGSRVVEGEYRYPGPRPRRKEIALVSLADCCEAACRSLVKPTPGKIAGMVDKVINQRVREHQLDSADLTFAELATVRETIIRNLGTMLHARVAYDREEKAGAKTRSSGQIPQGQTVKRNAEEETTGESDPFKTAEAPPAE